VVDTLERRDAIQRDLGRLETWVCAHLVRLNKAKCKVPGQGVGNRWPLTSLPTQAIL